MQICLEKKMTCIKDPGSLIKPEGKYVNKNIVYIINKKCYFFSVILY
jgi:hypothetical protein